MSCAVALGSQDEFKYWLTLYVKALARAGHGAQLQLLSDILLGKNVVDTFDVIDASNTDTALYSQDDDERKSFSNQCCWWLGNAPTILVTTYYK
jgi:TUP1-like enhancer of split